jgi:hypothetical protein
MPKSRNQLTLRYKIRISLSPRGTSSLKSSKL